MLIQRYTLDWVRWFGSGWRDGPSGYQVRETLCYFMDFNLTRLPLLSGSSLPALEPCWCRVPSTCRDLHASSCNVGTHCGVDGVFWGDSGGRDSCWHGGDEFLEHGHHVFHLFRVLCLKHICYLGDDHDLSLGIREDFFRCLVRNALVLTDPAVDLFRLTCFVYLF